METEPLPEPKGHGDTEVGTACRLTLAPCSCGEDIVCTRESVDKASVVRKSHMDEEVPTHVEIEGALYNVTMLTVRPVNGKHETDSASRNNTIILEPLDGHHYLYLEHYYTKCENTGPTEATGSVAPLVCSKIESESSEKVPSLGSDTVVDERTVKYKERVSDTVVCYESNVDNRIDTSR